MRRMAFLVALLATAASLLFMLPTSASAATTNPAAFVPATPLASVAPPAAAGQVVPFEYNAPECVGGADYGWFCAYSGPNFTGYNIGMYYCDNYAIPWTSVGSWDNNQTAGTRPILYWVNGAAPWHMPAAWSDQASGVNWAPVASITNC